MDSQTYVNFFRRTSPYIHAHRGKTFVIALSGDAVLDANCQRLLADIALLQSLGVHIVLVHGARPQIDRRLAQSSLSSELHDHLRITGIAAMHCVKEAIGSTRLQLESELSMGLPNSPMHGAEMRVMGGNFVTAKPLGVIDGVDHLHSGEVRRIDRTGIQRQLECGAIVLLSPIGFSPTGEAFNLSYLDVATHTATAIEADKLICISSTPGICVDGALQRSLSLPAVEALLKHLPLDSQAQLERKLLSASLHACKGGVGRAHLIGFGDDGALLSELFTREGSGTLIVQDYSETLRPASIDDVGGIIDLIQPLEDAGVLVRRSRDLLETEISRFMVALHPEGFLIGCAALYPIGSSGSGEIACVATHADFLSQGTASRLLSAIEAHARNQSMDRLYVLTTQAAHWFQEQGFTATTVESLPDDKKLLYNYQRSARVLCKKI